MGIEEDIKDIRDSLLVIKETLCLTYGIEPRDNKPEKEKAPKNISEEKEIVSNKNTKKLEQEINSNEEILYTCTNCGVSFARGEEHACKPNRKSEIQ